MNNDEPRGSDPGVDLRAFPSTLVDMRGVLGRSDGSVPNLAMRGEVATTDDGGAT